MISHRGGFFMHWLLTLAGTIAGAVNGLFGAGGGMVLVPLLGSKTGIPERERFPTSIAIIAPICVVSLLFSARWNMPFLQLLPYLLGSVIGGIAAGYPHFEAAMRERIQTFPFETGKDGKVLFSEDGDMGLYGASAL